MGENLPNSDLETALTKALSCPDEGFECGKRLLDSSNTQDKLRGLQVLELVGKNRDRRVYPILIERLVDGSIAPSVLSSLSNISDSRALFPVINFASLSFSPEIMQRTLQYMHATRDPRAVAFLEDYLAQTDFLFMDVAQAALERCRDNFDFLYRYAGDDKNLEQALQAEGRIEVSAAELTAHKHILDEDKKFPFLKPQTYIVDKEGVMFIGGYLNEHVMVAKGADVRAAGEIAFSFSEDSGLWSAEYITHRSSGYFPAATCLKWVKRFFRSSDVMFNKNAFDKSFPRNGYNDEDFLSVFKYGANYHE